MQRSIVNIVMDFVMRKVELTSDLLESTAGKRLTNLAYVDDICLFSDYLQDMSRMTEAVVCEAALRRIKFEHAGDGAYEEKI